MSIGNVIAEKRKNSGLTQEQFSERMGVVRQTVSAWENDIFIPDTAKIIQMAALFNCTTDDLLNPPATSGERSSEESVTVQTK
ncbi:MAG: helix-turn-helix transcriptional regulator [Eubacteriales bacterium]|nr:helix-turn-helix transcriptional regulator [Eubacteriales bacterium]